MQVQLGMEKGIWLGPLLRPLAAGYGSVMRMRRWAYQQGWLDSYRSPVRVVSVGNISLGGTGKTPVCEYVLSHLSALQPAYLSRGYGRKTNGYIRVDPALHAAQTVGDEALQVAHKFPTLPVAVCESRTDGIQILLKETTPRIIVLDDAFQHLKVQRDLNIVVIDANRLPTQDWILPAGRLREPRISLHAADLLIVNKVADPHQIPAIEAELAEYDKPMAFCCPQMLSGKSFTGTSWEWEDMQGLSLGAFAGIGNGSFFHQQLLAHNLRINHWRPFRDHYSYKTADLTSMASQQAIDKWITTEKDYFRLLQHPYWQKADLHRWIYIPIQLHWWQGENIVKEMLNNLSQKG